MDVFSSFNIRPQVTEFVIRPTMSMFAYMTKEIVAMIHVTTTLALTQDVFQLENQLVNCQWDLVTLPV